MSLPARGTWVKSGNPPTAFSPSVSVTCFRSHSGVIRVLSYGKLMVGTCCSGNIVSNSGIWCIAPTHGQTVLGFSSPGIGARGPGVDGASGPGVTGARRPGVSVCRGEVDVLVLLL